MPNKCMSEELSKNLTVVVPVRNRASVVGRTLRSIERQTLRPLTVILVDNGSTDSTLDVLTAWQKRVAGDIDVSIVSELQPGGAAARNAGLRLVGTEWTMFFDSDDEMAPDHCERALAAADGSDIVGWDTEYVMSDGRHAVKPFYTSDAQYHNLMHASMATLRYMARTKLFRDAGGWNPAVRYWDDIELGARLLALQPRMKKLEGKPRVTVYEGEDSITGTMYSLHTREAAKALEQMKITLGSDRPLWIKLKHAIFAADCSRERSEEGRDILRCLLAQEASPSARMLLRFAYYYRRCGGRGVARIIRFLV